MHHKKNYCTLSRRFKQLYSSYDKAMAFINKFSDIIAEENGYAPVRPYYCFACDGYHVTSQAYTKKQHQQLLAQGIVVEEPQHRNRYKHKTYSDMADKTARSYSKDSFAQVELDLSKVTLHLQTGMVKTARKQFLSVEKQANKVLSADGPKDRKRAIKQDLEWLRRQLADHSYAA